MAFSVINFGEAHVNLDQNQKRQDVVYYRKTAKTTDCASVLLTNDRRKMARNKEIRSQNPPPPVAVARRNARERNRVKQVNNGFATLRQHIPVSGQESGDNARSKKLSKVETLRMAVDYIRKLEDLLAQTSPEQGSYTSYTPNTDHIKVEMVETNGKNQSYRLLQYEDEENIHPEHLQDLEDYPMELTDSGFINSMHSTGSLSPELVSENSLSPRGCDVKNAFILEDGTGLVHDPQANLMTSWWEHEHLKS